MILRSLRLAQWSVVPFGLLLAVASIGACSSDSGGNQGFEGGGDDSGGGDVNAESTTDSQGEDAESGSTDDGSQEASDDGSGGDGAASDAGFTFDGFSDATGSDGNVCTDNDGDGWTTCGGDCNDHDSQINPCAFDTNDPNDPVGHDGLDNDCDGKVDNLILCETGIASGHDTNATHYANASDICDNPLCPRIKSALWYGPNNTNAHRITGHMGSSGQFNPKLGKIMTFLSTGVADDLTDSPNYRTGDGTDLQNTYRHPDPLKAAANTNACGQGQDESTLSCQSYSTGCVHDYTELRMTLTAPINAGSFAFDFAFFSEEYPEYVCSGFNDTFLAMLTSQKYPPNTYPNGFEIAYDNTKAKHRINVNSTFFVDCNSAVANWGLGYTHNCSGALSLLNGTGYEIAYSGGSFTSGNGNHGSGGSDWLHTTSPINPGETFTLSWIIFDERDGILDSAVILDHFHWLSTTLPDPNTAR